MNDYLIPVVWICALGAVVAAFLHIRNSRTLAIRIRFIELPEKPQMASFKLLPSYEQMLYSPAHWGRWTFEDWQKWLDARAAA
jgi:hypothetical protein